MVTAGNHDFSLRLERAEISRLTWALVISLALHLLVFGTYKAGRSLGWWERWHTPAWLKSAKKLAEVFDKKQPLPQQEREVPLIFLDVSPSQAVPEAPKEAKYYSDKNSQAANQQADVDSNVPKIAGDQTQVPRTETIPREKYTPLQPSRPAQAQEAQEEVKPKPTYAPGDLVMAKPEQERKSDGKAQEARPRTLKEARARQAENRLPGEQMKQEGGVRRRLEISSLDAKATPFGAYDAALVEAISQRWYNLLDARDYALDGRGKVVLQFHLHFDGRITDMNMAENSVGEVLGLLCEKAVLDPAPFGVWPPDMRRMLGDMRSIQFTFYYN